MQVNATFDTLRPLQSLMQWSEEVNLATNEGSIVSVDVKSGKRTQAKSLASYIEKCSPSKTFKLSGT